MLKTKTNRNPSPQLYVFFILKPTIWVQKPKPEILAWGLLTDPEALRPHSLGLQTAKGRLTFLFLSQPSRSVPAARCSLPPHTALAGSL